MDKKEKENHEIMEKIISSGNPENQKEQMIQKIKAHDVLEGKSQTGNVIKKDEMTNDQKNWKIKSLKEHLGILEESMVWAIHDYENFEKKLEINPSKREELENSIDNIGAEIELVKRELRDLEH